MMAMMGNMRNPLPNTNANMSAENSNDQKRKAEEKQEELLVHCALNTK